MPIADAPDFKVTAQPRPGFGPSITSAVNVCLTTVIRVAGEDLLRAIKLLNEHAPDEKMRPGHGAERELQGRLLAHRRGQAVGAADEEGDIADAIAPPALKPLGERVAGQDGAVFVERDDHRARRHRGEQECAFALFQFRRRELSPLLHLADRERPSEALGIVSNEVGMRSRLEAADRHHVEAHGRRPGRGLGRHRGDFAEARAPHLFQVVEGAGFRAEEVDDDVARVDQDPIAVAQSLAWRAAMAVLA